MCAEVHPVARERQGKPARYNFHLLHPDCLHIHEFLDAIAAELAAIAGTLDPAERRPRIGAHLRIDEDAARHDMRCDLFRLVDVLGQYRSAEPVLRVVGDADRFIIV